MTTTVQTIASNPFALMMNPEAVFLAMAQSDRLARLSSRICRPLDKPIVAKSDAATASDADKDGDAEIDLEPELPVEIAV